MQFLHWLLRAPTEKGTEESNSSTSTDQKGKKVEGTKDADQPTKHIVVFKHYTNGVKQRGKSDTKGSNASYKKYLKKLFVLCRKDIATACFHSSINLKSPSTEIYTRSHQYWINSVKMKNEDIISKGLVSMIDQASAQARDKVLPISEATTGLSKSKTSTSDYTRGALKRGKGKGDEAKKMSRMKELMRWAASAKLENGGKLMGQKALQSTNRRNPKAVTVDDQFSYESPKISFRWDVGCCSTTSSNRSSISVTCLKNNPNLSMVSLNSSTNNTRIHSPTRRGNWITTDLEFVVLEL